MTIPTSDELVSYYTYACSSAPGAWSAAELRTSVNATTAGTLEVRVTPESRGWTLYAYEVRLLSCASAWNGCTVVQSKPARCPASCGEPCEPVTFTIPLEAGVRHYRTRAFTGGVANVALREGSSRAWTDANEPPSRPAFLTASGPARLPLLLAWSPSNDPEGATLVYELEGSPDGAAWAALGSTRAQSFELSAAHVAGFDYSVRLRASDGRLFSPWAFAWFTFPSGPANGTPLPANGTLVLQGVRGLNATEEPNAPGRERPRLDLRVPNGLEPGVRALGAFVDGRPAEGAVTITSPAGRVYERNLTGDGLLEFDFDEPGTWNVTFANETEPVVVRRERRPNREGEGSPLLGLALLAPSGGAAWLVLLAAAGALAWAAHARYRSPRLVKSCRRGEVEVRLAARGPPLEGLELTDLVPEGAKAESFSEPPAESSETLFGTRLRWRRDRLARGEWRVRYRLAAEGERPRRLRRAELRARDARGREVTLASEEVNL